MLDRRALHNSGLIDKACESVEFYTPERILKRVRHYFGGDIDLDPATPAHNPTKARRWFTHEDNGLSRNWSEPVTFPRVFVNPPYGKAIKAWVEKIGVEGGYGRTRLVALLPGQRFEQTYWQQSLFIPSLTALIAVRSRVSFIRPDGKAAVGNPYGSFLYVYNGQWDAIVDAFAPIGMVIEMGRIAHKPNAQKSLLFDGGDQVTGAQPTLFGEAGK